MNTIHLLNKAINFATIIHRTQKRKGSDIPYITHPLAVAVILARVTNDENVIVAGILHDTVEDCEPYGSVTKDFVTINFNLQIAKIVQDLSEEDKTLPWLDRKEAALKHIPHMEHDSLLVKSADVLHNLTCLIEDVEAHGDKGFDKFNASKEDTITRYKLLETALAKAWKENPLLADIQDGIKELLRTNNSKFTTVKG